jgi:hypothetical protein
MWDTLIPFAVIAGCIALSIALRAFFGLRSRRRMSHPVSEPTPGPRKAKPPVPPLDEIQFTVYRPKVVRPGVWYPLLAFAHLAERRPEAPPDEPDPFERAREQAREILGDRIKEFRDTSVDARQAVPRDGEISLVPHVPGVEFNPPHALVPMAGRRPP